MECEIGEAIDGFRRVYSMLEDAESKETYLLRFNYLMTGDKRYIDHIVEKYLPALPIWVNGTARLVQAVPKETKVVLYGAGVDAEMLLPSFKNNQHFMGMCDQDLEKQKHGFHGCRVMPPDELVRQYRDAVVVVSTTMYADEIEQFLLENHFSRHQIVRIEPYIDAELPDAYFGMDFLHFGSHEIFVDGGCYNLETTCLFMRHCKQVDKVFAFEPDPANFVRCELAKERKCLSQVELIPCGTWSRDASVSFESASNPGSRISSDGNTSVQLTSIDNVVGSAPVTFIKLDVEGAELESLKGAQETIRRNRPQLAICIYHKPEDMVELPLYVKSLVSDYRLYVRQLGNAPWTTVLYAV